MAQHETGYLIHKSGRGWYCPGAKGYTLAVDEAGRFDRKEAIASTHPNGPDGPRDGLSYQHESEVTPGSSCEKDLRIHDLTRERDDLRAAQEELNQALNAALARINDLEAQLRGTEAAIGSLARLYA